MAAFERLAQQDPGFSLPVLEDFLQLVHRRATEAAVQQDWSTMAPFVSPETHRGLERLHDDVTSLSDVVLAAIRTESLRLDARSTTLVVRFVGSRKERTKPGAERRSYLEEVWTFRRAAGAHSLRPDAIRRMGCPSCGSALDTDKMGQCRSCGEANTGGRFHWQAVEVRFDVPRRSIAAPELLVGPGGEEPGYRLATQIDPRLGAETRAFSGRHPDFSTEAFEAFARSVFEELQAAWSESRWERLRPHVTDTLFQTLRFSMEGYANAKLQNRLEDVRVERVQIVRIRLDAWYEAVTVRIWASMRDFVVDSSGQVVGGNASEPRAFSEYWTFLRSAGGKASVSDAHHCPSCGAELDKVNAAGVCGYCDSRITTGEFNWVLSRIDQPSVYE
jgi:predicted lipid-binding transport protein (Tim44 family)